MTDMPGGGADGSDAPDESEADGNTGIWMNVAEAGTDEYPPAVNVKEEWEGITIYLPKSLRDDLELAYRELSLDCKRSTGADVQKLRDFYPLVVALGLEQLDDTKPEDVFSTLSYLLEE